MKKLFLMMSVILFILSQVACSAKMHKIKNVLDDYVVEFEDITSMDDDATWKNLNSFLDGWNNKNNKGLFSGFGCTVCIKNIGGKMLMSRNMDYTLDKNTECIFKINAKDRYKSINTATTAILDDESFEKIIKDEGIDVITRNMLANFVTDGINEKGLTIAANLRENEFEEGSDIPKFYSSGINPGKKRISICSITRIALDKCSSVDELLKLFGAVDSVTGEKYGEGDYDFYTPLSGDGDMIYCFSIMDVSGRKGVLEPINNKLIWTEDAKCQTNFFIDKDTEKEENYGEGYGRLNYVMQNYDNVNTEEEFFNLTKKVFYSLVERNEASFDISTESVNSDVFGDVEFLSSYAKENGIEIPDTKNLKQTMIMNDGKKIILTFDNYKQYNPEDRGKSWTKDFVEKDETGEVKAKIVWDSELYKKLTNEQARELEYFWNTSHHALYNATDKTLKIEFWEKGKIFNFDFTS